MSTRVTDVLRQIAGDMFDPRILATVVESAAALVGIALLAMAALRVFPAAIRRAHGHVGRPVPYEPVIESAVRYAIAFAALVLMLQVVHINLTALIASAGIVSLAFGFGAQYLIRDVLAGVFLISEGIVQTGDLIRIDGDAGTVERITLRTLQLRKFSGELVTIPNGAVTKIANLSRGYGRAIVQITVPYAADIGRALQALRDVGREWAAAHPDQARGEPTVDGAVEFRETGVTIQLSVQVPPGAQDGVAAALRRRMLEILAERQIKIDTRVSVTI